MRALRGPGDFPAGAKVRIVGLVKAAQHNGKTATVSRKAAPAGRVAVKLDDGPGVLSVKPANLERLPVDVSDN